LTIVTPMMRQYQAMKEQYSDCLLFFRLGDFYELFYQDAEVASRELNIVLTARDKTPMCGVPHHAVNNYLARLIEKGYKVAICEQMEDPKTAKGIVKRDVIRVVTPGTVLEDNMLQEKCHNYLAACWREQKKMSETGYGLAYVDISSGEFYATEFYGDEIRKSVADELARIMPSELLLTPDLMTDELFAIRLLHNSVGTLSQYDDEKYIRSNYDSLLQIHFKVAHLDGLGLGDHPLAAKAAAMILDFLQQTQKRTLTYIDKIKIYDCGEFMVLDAATRRNLELTATLRGNQRRGTLLWVMDETRTAMGGRLLREWLESPLINADAINRRLDAVSELIAKPLVLDHLRSSLGNLYDVPRLISRICYGSASPKDLAALRQTLSYMPEIFQLLSQLKSPVFSVLFDSFDTLDDIYQLLLDAISETPPVSAKDPGVIRKGYSPDIDELRLLTDSSKDLLLELEAREREKTGIKTLKVRYNKVFGYYIEISKSKAEEVPADYIRKQTLVNAERFITEELKELESRALSAGDRLTDLEYKLFCEIRDKVAAAAARILACADVLSHLDVFQSLAQVALENHFCRPDVNEGNQLMIKDGRHPVVEKILSAEGFIPNDTYLDQSTQRMMIITGPNMAGKSTYMRQVALIVLLAQIGSYVPAAAASIGCCDRIFTRVGASDDLAAGQSTFMVEMNETSNILRHATSKSLIILDEIGRGTSTFDGLSIAWAVAEFIIDDRCGAKTLFATHYHELTNLSDTYPLIRNFSIAVKEKGDKIVFLRKIIEGGADRSYGIQVAQLAGLPKAVIRRAEKILAQLEQEKHAQADIVIAEQLSFDAFDEPVETEESAILKELKELDINTLSPIEALLKIHDWKATYDTKD